MANKKILIKPEIQVLRAYVRNKELNQYRIAKETRLSYRTILRTLRPMESQGYIRFVRTEPSSRGSIDSKIYSLSFKGTVACLNSYKPSTNDFEVNGKIQYSLDTVNAIIKDKIQPYNLLDIANMLKNVGKDLNFPIFEQIDWLKEHYGEDVFRAIIFASGVAVERDKLPNMVGVRDIMLKHQHKSSAETESTLQGFLNLETWALRDSFTEAFVFQLLHLHGKGSLHNKNLYSIIAKVVTEIEQRNQSTLIPLKRLVESLS